VFLRAKLEPRERQHRDALEAQGGALQGDLIEGLAIEDQASAAGIEGEGGSDAGARLEPQRALDLDHLGLH
jgi:hypothetical protein